MNLGEIIGAYIDNTGVVSIYLGDILIWTLLSDKYLEISPDSVWVNETLPAQVDVSSNTDWRVR